MAVKPTILIIGEAKLTPLETWSSFSTHFNILPYNFPTIEDFHTALLSAPYNSISAILKIGYFPPTLERLEQGWTRAALRFLPASLKLIVQLGHGYEQEDISGLMVRGIDFRNSTGGSEATAMIGLYLIIAAFRHLRRYERMAREGKFLEAMGDSARRAEDPFGKSVGIIGMGAVGRALARQLKGLGMKLHYVERSGVREVQEEFPDAVGHASLGELLGKVDCVVLACPYSAETHHILDFEEFSKMRKGVRVVNIARGKCMNESALLDALKMGIVSGAGLDVYETEPEINPRFLNDDRVTILPHVGGLSRDAIKNHELICIDIVRSFFLDDPLG